MIVTGYVFSKGGSAQKAYIDAGEVSMLIEEEVPDIGCYSEVVHVHLRNGGVVTLTDHARKTSTSIRKGMNAT